MGTGSQDERTLRVGGRRVPYPEPSKVSASRVMRGNRGADTGPEVALRSALHARGLRFRKNRVVNVGDVRCRPDIVFPRQLVAVFVDGCFWHQCPEHGNLPSANSGYWRSKLAANVERDRRVDDGLRSAGWTVIRIWEHESPDESAVRVEQALRIQLAVRSSR